jgi:hypothetical protein
MIKSTKNGRSARAALNFMKVLDGCGYKEDKGAIR